MQLNEQQRSWVSTPLGSRVYLEGPAGSGKTTAAAARLERMVCDGVPAEQVLVFVPQRTLGLPYQRVIDTALLPPGGRPQILTLGGLAQRMVTLFWPLVAGQSGFAQPNRPPVFLTLETAQCVLGEQIRPYLAKGYFEGLRIDQNRLNSQILDNLNKAAVNNLDLTMVDERLQQAWAGKDAQRRYYAEAVHCARIFRAYCLQHNLLDYSLQVELFSRSLWDDPTCRDYLNRTYRHIIYDNPEEDVPVAHRLVLEWLPELESAFLVSDTEGGFRAFLGADPCGVEPLRAACQVHLATQEAIIEPAGVKAARRMLAARIGRRPLPALGSADVELLRVKSSPNYPGMVLRAVEDACDLITSGTASAGEIAILAPFMGDTLQFSLGQALEKRNISYQTLRPSRSLSSDPYVRCLLTWAKLAHPHWELPPHAQDVREALHLSIDHLDSVRASLLAQRVYKQGALHSSADMPLVLVGRIRADFVNLYEEKLYQWLGQYLSGAPCHLDAFLARLFGEVLAQQRFAFHQPGPPVDAVAMLVESARKFRQSMAETGLDSQEIGRSYIQMVERGVLSSQYLLAWQDSEQNAVRLSPAYTFIMSNRPVKYQLWLDIGSLGWWQRIQQPLTQPYVLSPHWPPGRPWTDRDELENNQAAMERLVSGLLRRCSGRILLYAAGQNEGGYEERGPLLAAVQGVLRAYSRQQADAHG